MLKSKFKKLKKSVCYNYNDHDSNYVANIVIIGILLPENIKILCSVILNLKEQHGEFRPRAWITFQGAGKLRSRKCSCSIKAQVIHNSQSRVCSDMANLLPYHNDKASKYCSCH